MSNGLNKILTNLKEHNDSNGIRQIQAAHQAKVAAARATGPTKDQIRRSDIKQCIHTALQAYPSAKHVSFEPMQFVESQMTINEGEPSFSHYGWREAQLNCQYYLMLTIKDEWTVGSGRFGYGSKPNGKYRIYVGDRDSKTFFKQKADGTHRYSDIARDIHFQIQKYIADAARAQAVKDNVDSAKSVHQLLDQPFKSYNGITLFASSDPAKPVQVKIDTTITLPVEIAASLLNFLKQTHGIG